MHPMYVLNSLDCNARHQCEREIQELCGEDENMYVQQQSFDGARNEQEEYLMLKLHTPVEARLLRVQCETRVMEVWEPKGKLCGGTQNSRYLRYQ